jgi:hypothetical protein
MSQQIDLVFADEPVEPVQVIPVSDDPVQRERDEIIAQLDIFADNIAERNPRGVFVVKSIIALIEARGERYE